MYKLYVAENGNEQLNFIDSFETLSHAKQRYKREKFEYGNECRGKITNTETGEFYRLN